MSNSSDKIERQWDEVYASGDKYKDEKPLPFTDDIIRLVKETMPVGARGLYIGCGNGRNFGALLDAGLSVAGLDISTNALGQLESRYPAAELVHADFLNYVPNELFDYVVSIQIFQHGTAKTAKSYIQKVHALLRTDGLFFLRVKSTNMDMKHPHTITERPGDGSFTAHFSEGPKRGLDIHYYSRTELESVALTGFESLMEPREITLERPGGGTRSHWEGIWIKKEA